MKRLILTLLSTCCLACTAPAARAQGEAAPEGKQLASADELPPKTELAEADRLNAEVVKLFRAGKFDEALPHARRVVELREQALGGNHLLVAHALSNVGTIHLEKRKDGEAEPLLKRALAIAEKGGPAGRPLVIAVSNQLAAMRYRDRDYKEAEEHLRRSLALTEAEGGANHFALARVLLNFTDLNYQQRRAAEAEAYLARAVDILLKQPPQADPYTAERLKRYVCLFTEESRAGELSKRMAKALYRLEEPEKAAEVERAVREHNERGGEDMPAVQGGVLTGRVASRFPPAYPSEAKDKGLQGKVVVRITVDEEGKVIKAERFCGNPILSEAAVASVRRWRFTPTTLDGQPVKVTGTVTVNFVLHY